MRPLVDEPDLLGLNGLGHFVPLVLSFPTIPNLAMVQKIFANVFTVIPFYSAQFYLYNDTKFGDGNFF